MNFKYIHLGSNRFNFDKWQPIKNSNSGLKPYGGLWASPVNSEFGWIDLLKRWGSIINDVYKDCFVFNLKQTASIYTIDCFEDLYNVPYFRTDTENLHDLDRRYIDFELMSKHYNAIHVTYKGILETQDDENYNLKGWDVESLLIFHKEALSFKVQAPIKLYNLY